MRIGIEAQRLFRVKKHGMDIFAMELIKALQAADTPHEFFVFVKPDEDDNVIAEKDNFKIIRLEGSPYPWWEQRVLPAAVRKYKIDVLHCTANTAPVFTNTRMITTLHDIIYLEKIEINKGTLYQRVGNLYRRWNVPLVARKSKLICTVSDYERERIIDRLKVSPEKVVTVYNGVGEHFKKISDTTVLNSLRQKYKLPDNYILFLGNPAPKKNVRGLLQALAILKKENKLTLPVVIPDLSRHYILQLLEDLGEEKLIADIVACGYIPNTDLPGIYSTATVFLYPSLRESFGIPILEAMACGVPVVTSNTSSMPEVAGDAALLADPLNPQSIAEKIDELLTDTALRESLITKGYARANNFSWQNTAEQVLKLYDRLMT